MLGFIVGLILTLIGCSTLTTEYRKIGQIELQRSFRTLPDRPMPDTTVTLKNVTVKIVASRNAFEHVKFAQNDKILGYATRNNEIWVLGKMVNGKIIVNQGVLGHELNHLLNFANPDIADPDKLDELGV